MAKEFNKDLVKTSGNVKVYHIHGTKEDGKTYDFQQVILEKTYFDKNIGKKVVNEMQISLEDLDNLVQAKEIITKQ